MTENTQQNNNIEEIPFEDRIPLPQRDAFQKVLLAKMGAERGKHELQMELSVNFGGKISSIIDDTSRKDNKIIRDLIMKGKNKEAAEIVDDIFKKEIYN